MYVVHGMELIGMEHAMNQEPAVSCLQLTGLLTMRTCWLSHLAAVLAHGHTNIASGLSYIISEASLLACNRVPLSLACWLWDVEMVLYICMTC